ncbi:very short patch repair endonuclease [Alcanivorax sp. DP30]|uniref:very short patch repair endonuclease n=1 Tax=Alcanivorax sp. DP30 TaxID=2606217 RepID=UPI00136D394B|nr:DNA mismatch endonuclease Vsr [Alcanivorax sp. DP30]MZR64301.1 DNA mismatch endonuclease Vsr [Alcanivorax sp. DP30]
MADVVDKATRSRMMAGIKGKDTKPEMLIRSELHRRGFRFRKNVKELPGKPDIVLPKYKAVIMVNGCFWHGHECRFFKWPSTRKEFWREKISRNKQRDKEKIDDLVKEGWRVLTIWECSLKKSENGEAGEVFDNMVSWILQK